MKKRLLCLLLTMVMVIGMMPMAVEAVEEPVSIRVNIYDFTAKNANLSGASQTGIVGEYTGLVPMGASAAQALEVIFEENGIPYVMEGMDYGHYLSSVNHLDAMGFGGWMLAYNHDGFDNWGLDAVTMSEGDCLELHYTVNGGADIGAAFMGLPILTGLTLGSTTVTMEKEIDWNSGITTYFLMDKQGKREMTGAGSEDSPFILEVTLPDGTDITTLTVEYTTDLDTDYATVIGLEGADFSHAVAVTLTSRTGGQTYYRLHVNTTGEPPVAETYTIAATATTGGTVTGSGTYEKGATVTLTATPNTGYTFDGWYENNTKITDANATYTFTATANRNLEAKFTYSGGSGGIVTTTTYTIAFNTDGGSAIDSQSITSGDKATRPTDPTREGYTFDGWYTDQALTTAYDFTSAVTGNITLYAKWAEIEATPTDDAPAAWENPFSDVAEGSWYSAAVQYVSENSMMNGMSGSIFSPNTSLTRAMPVQILYNLEGQPSPGAANFIDVAAGSWYCNAVAWAANNGIVNGVGDGRFAPDNNITREQMAVMLYNYCNFKGIELPAIRERSSFTDANAISDWAVEAVEVMYQAGILSGRIDGSFDPKGTATRAEVAQMFMNFMEIIQ